MLLLPFLFYAVSSALYSVFHCYYSFLRHRVRSIKRGPSHAWPVSFGSAGCGGANVSCWISALVMHSGISSQECHFAYCKILDRVRSPLE